MNITHIDHIVLTVKNIDVTIIFYESILGMTAEKFGDGRRALTFGHQKINLHEQGKEFEPKAHNPMPGSADLCFITDTSIDIAMKHVSNNGVDILEGPLSRTGAVGNITSFYFRDPDNNLVEISNY